MRLLALLIGVTLLTASQVPAEPPATLPANATAQLAESIDAAAGRPDHVWAGQPPLNADGTVNVYIEIPRGERNKWELDMQQNARVIDRVLPELIGPYPVNYGFVPQTVFYDGDPFDALVLGPALDGGTTVRGVIAGMMYMEDEKGLDSKVVVSPVDAQGQALHVLSDAERRLIGDYFNEYKRLDPGAFSHVPGWGTPSSGLAHVETAHAFFRECARVSGPCTLRRK